MEYELALEQYQGPLDKLLELIEERKLQITEISLAQVTDDFLNYLETLKGNESETGEKRTNLRLLADFIVVASRLVFIKSKSLLPELELTHEEEADIKDLQYRLLLYKECKPAIESFISAWRKGHHSFARPYFLASGTLIPGNGAHVFCPGAKTSPDLLSFSLGALLASFEALAMEKEVVRDTVISLEEKMKEVVVRLERIVKMSFKTISELSSRGEMIVTFLALLQLAREKRIILEQREHLSDILITKPSAQEKKKS